MSMNMAMNIWLHISRFREGGLVCRPHSQPSKSFPPNVCMPPKKSAAQCLPPNLNCRPIWAADIGRQTLGDNSIFGRFRDIGWRIREATKLRVSQNGLELSRYVVAFALDRSEPPTKEEEDAQEAARQAGSKYKSTQHPDCQHFKISSLNLFHQTPKSHQTYNPNYMASLVFHQNKTPTPTKLHFPCCHQVLEEELLRPDVTTGVVTAGTDCATPEVRRRSYY